MGKKFDSLTTRQTKFIRAQKIFFVATAAEEGTVNLSPKGMDYFRVIDENKVVWLNLTGSGNETAAHLLKNNRMTIMFCAFEGKPLILRLYGNAKIFHTKDDGFKKYNSLFEDNLGTRQIIEMNVNLVQTSCGFGVPYMDYIGDRETLNLWAEQKGKKGIRDYWEEKNQKSIDGFPTNIPID